MATLNDVAKKANVSKMTVSRVINYPDKVSEELKTLVYQAMQDLSYVPNRAAQALAKKRTNVIKIVILEEIDTVEPYYMMLLMGIAQELNLYQYALRLLVNPTHDDGDCDGYIITGMREHDYEWIQSLDKPVVLFGENEKGIDFIDSNNQKAVALATEHALKYYTHCVYIGMNMQEQFAMQREKGYLHIMQQKQKESSVYTIENRSSSAYAITQKILPSLPVKTCFICSSDRIGLGVLRALQESNMKIPVEYGVIGFDGVFLDRIASPHLTTIKQPLLEIGKACVQTLIKKINDPDASQKTIYFDAELIKAETTMN